MENKMVLRLSEFHNELKRNPFNVFEIEFDSKVIRYLLLCFWYSRKKFPIKKANRCFQLKTVQDYATGLSFPKHLESRKFDFLNYWFDKYYYTEYG